MLNKLFIITKKSYQKKKKKRKSFFHDLESNLTHFWKYSIKTSIAELP